jgi:hypothetical protein
MKKALIDPRSSRIAQVMAVDEVFPVGPPLYWKDCADGVQADKYVLSGEQILPKQETGNPPPKSETERLMLLLKEKGVLSEQDTLK